MNIVKLIQSALYKVALMLNIRLLELVDKDNHGQRRSHRDQLRGGLIDWKESSLIRIFRLVYYQSQLRCDGITVVTTSELMK